MRILAVLFLVGTIIGCHTKSDPGGAHNELDGATLARIHCASCHVFPEPRLLDIATWDQYVLPRMGAMLGIYSQEMPRDRYLEVGLGGQKVDSAQVFPTRPVLSPEQWERLRNFYLSRAPQALPLPEKNSLPLDLKLFKPRFPDYYFSPPSATLVHFAAPGEGFFVGDANSRSLLRFNRDLELLYARPTGEGAVWIEPAGNRNEVLVMASFSPTDAPGGQLLEIPDEAHRATAGVVLEGLQRPVHFARGDLNDDGRSDLVVCEFGKWTGGLSWWKNQGNGRYKRHWLRNQPGAIKAYLRDWDGDGRQDVVALFGQGDEGIYLFRNLGEGAFREERLLRFPSTYGSSFFDFYDWDGDGDEDILYTAGDNADYSPILKPYHGIRLFLNDGQNRFEEAFFFHLNGAYGAIARDFDLDGDTDLAAISFFPDFAGRPEESFVFLENLGNMQFSAHTLPQAQNGRWIVMDAGDGDGDGDLDLLLGSLAFEVLPDRGEVGRWVQNGLLFMYLENQSR